MKFNHIYIALAILAAALSSCTKEQRDAEYSKQETKIENFINKQIESNPDIRVEYNEGSVRIVLSEGEGVELNARGSASIYYAGYDFSNGSISNSNMFTTNSPDYAASAGWKLSDESGYGPLEIDLTDNDVIDGLRSGLEGVRQEEECYIIFSGKHGFGQSKIGTIPANAPLAFLVKVKAVQN